MKVFVVQFLVALVLPNLCISLPLSDSTTDSLVLVKDATTQNTEVYYILMNFNKLFKNYKSICCLKFNVNENKMQEFCLN